MASRRYRGRNSLNGNVTHSNARLSSIEKRSIPTTISAGAIDGALLAESSVTSINLAPGSVQGENIATGAVNTGNLADASVTSAKLAPDALAGIEVGENSVDTAQLVDGAVTNIKIRDAAVNDAKISDVSGSKINTGTVAATYIGDLDAGKITSGTFNINRIPDVSSKVSSLDPGSISTGNLNLGGTGTLNAGYYATLGDCVVGFDSAYTKQGLRAPYVNIDSGANVSGSVDTGSVRANSALYVGNSTAGLGIDSNQINAAPNAVLYLNGSGSSGAVIIGDGGGNTSVRNQLNAQGGILVTGGGITASSVYSNLVTGRDMFISSAGVMGYATSSRKYKRDIEELQLDPEAILNIQPISFKYNPGLLKEENGNDPDEVQWGFVAEDLHDAGLVGIVDYDPETGDVEGIKYSKFVIALQAVVRSQAEQISALTARIEALEAR